MNDKAQGLSIRKLTRNNPTMKAAFAEAREECAPPGGLRVPLGRERKGHHEEQRREGDDERPARGI